MHFNLMSNDYWLAYPLCLSLIVRVDSCLFEWSVADCWSGLTSVWVISYWLFEWTHICLSDQLILSPVCPADCSEWTYICLNDPVGHFVQHNPFFFSPPVLLDFVRSVMDVGPAVPSDVDRCPTGLSAYSNWIGILPVNFVWHLLPTYRC